MNVAARQQGFVLAAVLVMSGIAALLTIDALTGAALAQAGVTRLRLRQSAFELAEGALASLADRLADDTAAVPLRQQVDASHVTAVAHLRATESTPEGFSAGVFRVEHFDLEAGVSAPRGTQLALRAGLARWTTLP